MNIGIARLLLWVSILLNKGEMEYAHIHHIGTNVNGLLLNGIKTIENMESYPSPEYSYIC